MPRSALYDWLLGKKAGAVALVLLTLACVYLFVFRGTRFFMVPSGSMEPTLMPSDMLVTMREPAYRRGDIVVLRHNGEYLVKRIVGLGGDSLMVVDGALFINGKYASEPYVREPMRYAIDSPVAVPGDGVFFLGDNRNQSDDSSLPKESWDAKFYYDLASVSDIVGRVVFRYYPYDRWGPVASYPLTNSDGA